MGLFVYCGIIKYYKNSFIYIRTLLIMANVTHKVLLNQAGAGTTDWVQVDSVDFSDLNPSTLQISLTSGDTITIEGITQRFKGIEKDFSTLTAVDITEIAEVTASGFVSLVGTWTYIRVIKTGTAGNAKVQGRF